MIFVTVGTHEQQFNRLVERIDVMKGDGILGDEEVFIQTGFSTYEPKWCKWSKLIPHKELSQYMNEARIIITHGGPASFVMPLQLGKVPIVVPRRVQFDEHVNDHQVLFAREVARRNGSITLVETVDELEKAILEYEQLTAGMTPDMKSNNANFNKELEKLVEGLFSKR